MPLIGRWLQFDYEKASTQEELLDVTHKWFNEAERTQNQVRKFHYQTSAQYLYTLLIGKSYESKIL